MHRHFFRKKTQVCNSLEQSPAKEDTLWQTNIRMEDGPMYFLLKMVIFQPAMLVYWRVDVSSSLPSIRCQVQASSNSSRVHSICLGPRHANRVHDKDDNHHNHKSNSKRNHIIIIIIIIIIIFAIDFCI